MSSEIEIGDGRVTLALPDGRKVALGLPSYQRWASRWKPPEGADAWAFTEAVQAYVKDHAGLAVSFDEADAVAHGMQEAAKALRELRGPLYS